MFCEELRVYIGATLPGILFQCLMMHDHLKKFRLDIDIIGWVWIPNGTQGRDCLCDLEVVFKPP